MKILVMFWWLGCTLNSVSGFATVDSINTNTQDQMKIENKISKGRDYSCTVTEGTALPVEWARGGHSGGVVEGNIIVSGGNNWSKDKTTKFWLKNSAVFKDGSWMPGPELPMPLAYSSYAYDNTGFYIAGGTTDGTMVSRNVYRLNSLNNGKGWEILPQLPEAVGYGAGAILDGKFFVACGSNGKEKSNRMFVLEIKNTGSDWIECKPLPGIARIFPSMVACGKYLYLLGGLSETSPLTPLDDLFRYDPGKNEWLRMKDLPFKGYAWVGQPVDKNHILVTGKADGTIHRGIWLIKTDDMSMVEIGMLKYPSTTAPLIPIAKKQWLLIAGEPDANKNRTEKVNVILLK